MSDEEPVDQKGHQEDHCKPKCIKTWVDYEDLRTRRRIGSGPESDGLYCLSGRKETDAFAYTSATTESLYLWHCRLGHPSFDKLKSLLPESVQSIISSVSHVNLGNNEDHHICHIKKNRVMFP